MATARHGADRLTDAGSGPGDPAPDTQHRARRTAHDRRVQMHDVLAGDGVVALLAGPGTHTPGSLSCYDEPGVGIMEADNLDKNGDHDVA